MATCRQTVCVAFLLLIIQMTTRAQMPPVPISPVITRLVGTDPDNDVAYVRLFLSGTLIPPSEVTPPPTLTAQCTQKPLGKPGFELFTNFGGITDYAYHRPWMAKDGPVPTPIPKVDVVMEFLGYMTVKPVKRQWESVLVPRGQLRYNTPGFHSNNMEDITFYLQYLKALPTLRLTYDGKTAEFLVTPLFEQIRKEPSCQASGL